MVKPRERIAVREEEAAELISVSRATLIKLDGARDARGHGRLSRKVDGARLYAVAKLMKLVGADGTVADPAAAGANTREEAGHGHAE